jgi:hypothetical protein
VYNIIERHTLRYIPTILLYVENPIEQQQQPKLLLFDGGPPHVDILTIYLLKFGYCCAAAAENNKVVKKVSESLNERGKNISTAAAGAGGAHLLHGCRPCKRGQ